MKENAYIANVLLDIGDYAHMMLYWDDMEGVNVDQIKKNVEDVDEKEEEDNLIPRQADLLLMQRLLWRSL